MEDIILNSITGLVIGIVIGPIVYGVIRHFVKQLKVKCFTVFDLYIKDDNIKNQILSKMLELQKKMKSNSGKEKFKLTVQFAKQIIPGNLDDVIVEKIVQAVYDEIAG